MRATVDTDDNRVTQTLLKVAWSDDRGVESRALADGREFDVRDKRRFGADGSQLADVGSVRAEHLVDSNTVDRAAGVDSDRVVFGEAHGVVAGLAGEPNRQRRSPINSQAVDVCLVV